MNSNTTIANFTETGQDFTQSQIINNTIISDNLIDSEYIWRPSFIGTAPIVIGGFITVWSLPNLQDTRATAIIPRPKQWKDGIIGVRFAVTTNGVNVNNFHCRWGIKGMSKTGNVIAGITFLYDSAQTQYITPTGVAGKPIIIESGDLSTDYCKVDESVDYLVFQIIRTSSDAGDTCVDDVYLIWAEADYFPNKNY